MRHIGLATWCFGVLLAVAACGDDEVPGQFRPDDDGGSGTADGGPDGTPDATPAPEFQRCVGAEFPVEPAGEWTNAGSALTAAAGAPGHFARDEIAVLGTTPVLRARFVYGGFSAALANERVLVFLDACEGWTLAGEAVTNATGELAFDVTQALPAGVYDARFVVVGDATTTLATLWVLPAGTHLAVTDIDGTMTSSDFELFQQILNGSYVPMAYPGAVDLTTAHDQLGHIVVFLTGRPGSLTPITRRWLADLGFALGPLKVTDSDGQILPTDAAVGTFKRDYLASLVDKGFVIDLAYGNATTDIFAYLGAQVPADDVWIIGSNAGMMGTNAVADSWEARVTEVHALPEVVQPW